MLEGGTWTKKVQECFFGEEISLSGVCFFSASKTAKLHLLHGYDHQKISEFCVKTLPFRPSCFIIHIKLCPFVPDRGQPVGFAVRATCYFLIRNSPPTLTDGVSPQNQISLSQLTFSTPHCEIAAPKIFSQPSSKMKGTAANRPSLKGYNNKISMGGG